MGSSEDEKNHTHLNIGRQGCRGWRIIFSINPCTYFLIGLLFTCDQALFSSSWQTWVPAGNPKSRPLFPKDTGNRVEASKRKKPITQEIFSLETEGSFPLSRIFKRNHGATQYSLATFLCACPRLDCEKSLIPLKDSRVRGTRERARKSLAAWKRNARVING